MNTLNIAVEGCCHGELDRIYQTIQDREQQEGITVDLLLICGDFESIRNYSDLECVAVPPKYRKLNTFHEYVMGTKVAPVLTIFIGGNHEASNVLQSLYYGGYVAPNIYFLGFAGVVNFRGLRIGGLSGIYNHRHYKQGKHERPPYNADSLRSIYHVRELEVFRMTHLQKSSVDVFLTHDWPNGIWEYGDKATLLRMKPFFKQDMDSGELGSPPAMQLLTLLKPMHWFSGHMHVKFEATFHHSNSSGGASSSFHGEDDDISGSKRKLTDLLGITETVRAPSKVTQFLALDKVLDKPGRDGKFLEIVQIPCGPWDSSIENDLHFDYEWLAVVKKTHYLVQDTRNHVKMPVNPFKITEQDVQEVRQLMLQAYDGSPVIPRLQPMCVVQSRGPPRLAGNTQTDRLLSALQLDHRWTCPVESFTPPTTMTMAQADSVFRAAKTSVATSSVTVSDDNAIDIDI